MTMIMDWVMVKEYHLKDKSKNFLDFWTYQMMILGEKEMDYITK